MAGHVRELRSAGNVASGVDTMVCTAQAVIDADTGFVHRNSRRFEVELCHAWLPTHGDQQMATAETLSRAIQLDLDHDAPFDSFNPDRLGTFDHAYPVAEQAMSYDGGGVLV